jgi:hypothetical protein
MDDDRPAYWEQVNVGKQFTVWLLHVADRDSIILGKEIPWCLVLGKPLGDEDLFERIGYLQIHDKDKAPQFSGQTKSIITIV